MSVTVVRCIKKWNVLALDRWNTRDSFEKIGFILWGGGHCVQRDQSLTTLHFNDHYWSFPKLLPLSDLCKTGTFHLLMHLIWLHLHWSCCCHTVAWWYFDNNDCYALRRKISLRLISLFVFEFCGNCTGDLCRALIFIRRTLIFFDKYITWWHFETILHVVVHCESLILMQCCTAFGLRATSSPWLVVTLPAIFKRRTLKYDI